jgi:hypothetical protein
MAKARKNRRAKKKRATPTRPMRPDVAIREEAITARQPAPVSFAEEYQYVIADLKRIFVLAAGMLALLIVLALVLR